ncbi:hypothetical protein JX265_010524 [Neoarthrinium moseri]|uniref:Short-chain dehydrogenase/reductase n=1 Tax=Neoarthrinium moseri TaxID=1658444 RepID=A0A9Q0AKH2_9PEZI|nr:uncharacterized protein JN550_012395 [Neoarthrinium moseri]KAI1846146.1 hypothetical protein JX266_007671 [Neoarthrinium moseri]KAI1858833.1 hypothetical protein JN550_012395 [Neoarthrinium moseri]KAI1859047.1 hypothetical protein JX265_010524 [Neoarthrinium moseri]
MAQPRKSVLITGCSAGGIGEAMAEAFLEKGYYVFATVRNSSSVSQSLSTAASVTIVTLDVLSSDSIAAAAELVQREAGGMLDVLVNNSGGVLFLPALDIPIEDGKKLFDLNFWGPFAMLQAFAPLLIKAQGCIVNNSSANAYAAMPLMSQCIVSEEFSSLSLTSPGVYNSSKAALAMASETWRHELRPLGVRTITLITFAVKTDSFSKYHQFALPETSNYFEIRDFIYSLSDGRLQDGAISARQYAIEVVREIEKGSVGTIWAGTNAWLSRFAFSLLPQSVMDKLLETIIPISSTMARSREGTKSR